MAERDTPRRRQLQQWLDSYVHLRGHEPTADEISEFIARHDPITRRIVTPVDSRAGAADSRRSWPLHLQDTGS